MADEGRNDCPTGLDAGREPSAHRLTELLTRDDLRSATGTTPWRSWRCSCGAVGSGYRWSSDIDLANEWGEHVAREATRSPMPDGDPIAHQAGACPTCKEAS